MSVVAFAAFGAAIAMAVTITARGVLATIYVTGIFFIMVMMVTACQQSNSNS